MKEDAEALDALYADILVLCPPGPRREFWLSHMLRMAQVTRCPNWRPKIAKPRLTLCRPPP
jgi:hypothetical protein